MESHAVYHIHTHKIPQNLQRFVGSAVSVVKCTARQSRTSCRKVLELRGVFMDDNSEKYPGIFIPRIYDGIPAC